MSLEPPRLLRLRSLRARRRRARRGYAAPLTRADGSFLESRSGSDLESAEALLGYLRKIGVARPPAPAAAASPIERLAKVYGEYLASERGLAASTIRHYTDFAKRFAVESAAGPQLKWERLKPRDITTFVSKEARRWSVGQAKQVVTALRSLLRYLHAEGWIARDLVGCVPAVAGWRLAGLPTGLEPQQVRRVLQSCNSRSATGLRAAAIVHLMIRLGLRAGDAAALTLDDFDWRVGEIRLRGKGRRESQSPLPHDVGRAVAAYLRDGRPHTDSRCVFLRSRAPHAPLTAGGVIHAIRSALGRAGIVGGGAHLLRHTAATQLLRRGASLPEIGHVLRHRHLDTTAIYAKVDFTALRTLAQPWPGAAA